MRGSAVRDARFGFVRAELYCCLSPEDKLARVQMHAMVVHDLTVQFLQSFVAERSGGSGQTGFNRMSQCVRHV